MMTVHIRIGMFDLDWQVSDPALAGIATYCGDANCAGLAPGHGAATAGTVAVTDSVAVPEPSTLAFALLGMALIAAAFVSRRSTLS